MRKMIMVLSLLLLSGCATQTPQMDEVRPSASEEQQREAQARAQASAAPDALRLKRKLAVGRLSNETNYGRSLLRAHAEDELSNKVTDMFLQALTNSESFLVFERPDIELLKDEAKLSGQEVEIVGVDTLVVGSLTEFGRSTTGERGFASSFKETGSDSHRGSSPGGCQYWPGFESVTGSGSSSTEHARTMGFGSAAGYDGSLNDQAIGAAVTAAVDKMTRLFMGKTWEADILEKDADVVYISGGESQGVEPGMVFDVATEGRRRKSETTGTTITLPGEKVAEIEVVSLFGDDVLNQGAVARITSGSIEGQELKALVVKEQEQ